MKYLKKFETENDYLAYRDDKSKYLKPNVSLCDGNSKVFYNYSPPPKTNGHDYVDLGLPSGTLWATCNVGASKPSDSGLFFQWGDVQGYTAEQVGTGEGKKAFKWSDYKWYESGSTADNSIKFKKYATPGATLELADDAANANMGGDWHMPTPTQIQELLDNTTTAWTTSNGTGMTFTSKIHKSKSIFIPAAGGAWDGSVYSSRRSGYVWYSMVSTSGVYCGQSLYFNSGDVGLSNNYRYGGRSVRGVLG